MPMAGFSAGLSNREAACCRSVRAVISVNKEISIFGKCRVDDRKNFLGTERVNAVVDGYEEVAARIGFDLVDLTCLAKRFRGGVRGCGKHHRENEGGREFSHGLSLVNEWIARVVMQVMLGSVLAGRTGADV
jgi:hypothetical protein